MRGSGVPAIFNPGITRPVKDELLVTCNMETKLPESSSSLQIIQTLLMLSSEAMELPLKNIPTKALVVAEPGALFVLTDVILDEVRDDEVLVEMKYTGLCHTVR